LAVGILQLQQLRQAAFNLETAVDRFASLAKPHEINA
jgi:hypothetical protein